MPEETMNHLEVKEELRERLHELQDKLEENEQQRSELLQNISYVKGKLDILNSIQVNE